ncbi:MAG: hypothetical protein JNM77_17820 [Pseudonocardia sp.]|nr:hypothetical protein [Pseudonocardia sp.]
MPVRHVNAPHRRGLLLLLRLALRHDTDDGTRPGDMAVLCHTRADVSHITSELTAHGIPLTALDSWDGKPDDNIKIGTINRAKGLDFAAVYVPHLNAEDPTGTGKETWYIQREYVARTRPRDRLWIGYIVRPTITSRRGPANQFLRQGRTGRTAGSV